MKNSSASSYSVIFFDLDGTLIDPKVGILNGIQYALEKYNIKADHEALLSFIGPPLNKSFQIKYGFSEQKAMEASMHYRDYFIPKGMYESKIYEGIYELLQNLKQRNKTISIVTSKPTFIAEKVSKHYKFETYFDKVIGAKPDMSNAAKGLLVKEARMHFPDVKTEAFVMIGDREHDIIGAKENDIDSIGVLYGYGSHEEITKAKPTHIAKTIEELKNYL